MLDILLGQAQIAPIEPGIFVNMRLCLPISRNKYQVREYASAVIFAVKFMVSLTELLSEKGKIKR